MADLPGAEAREVETGHRAEGLQAGMRGVAQRVEAPGNDRAVLAPQRRDIGDRAERRQFQQIEQIGFVVAPGTAQGEARLGQRTDERIGDPDRRQILERVGAVGAARVDDRHRLGHLGRDGMVVEDDRRPRRASARMPPRGDC